jgi:hypothetical protein
MVSSLKERVVMLSQIDKNPTDKTTVYGVSGRGIDPVINPELILPEEDRAIGLANNLGDLQNLAKLVLMRLRESGPGNVRMIVAPLDVGGGMDESSRKLCLTLASQNQKLMGRKIFYYLPFVERTAEILDISLADALVTLTAEIRFFHSLIDIGWIREFYFLPQWGESVFCNNIRRMAQSPQNRKNSPLLIEWWQE